MKKKGITPLVGTALLVLIAISAVTTAAVFLRDTTQDVTSSVNDQLSEEKKRENSGIDIEYAYNHSSNDIYAVVRNTGEYTLVIEEDNQKSWNVYADGKPKDFQYAGHPNPDSKTIDPGETVTIDTNQEFPAPNSYVTIEIEGTYGTESSILCSNDDGSGNC